MYTPKNMMVDMFRQQYKALNKVKNFDKIIEKYAEEIFVKIKELEKELTGED